MPIARLERVKCSILKRFARRKRGLIVTNTRLTALEIVRLHLQSTLSQVAQPTLEARE